MNEDGYAPFAELLPEYNLIHAVLKLADGASEHKYELKFEYPPLKDGEYEFIWVVIQEVRIQAKGRGKKRSVKSLDCSSGACLGKLVNPVRLFLPFCLL